jgi:hypothetical protein
MDKAEQSRRNSEKIKLKRQKFKELLGSKCACGKTGKEIYVYAKDIYEPAWMPAKGLYGHSWDDMVARSDDYFLSCNMCWRKRKGYKTIEHGGGSQGKPGCSCEPCKVKRNEYGRTNAKRYRDQAKLYRELIKEGRI